MSDGIIDLGEYIRRREGTTAEPSTTFALLGGEGERSRFALPLWRTIYTASGDRGGVVWRSADDGVVHPFIVLDLASDPPRTDFGAELLSGLPTEEAPQVIEHGEGRRLAIYLGDRGGRFWYLIVLGDGEPKALTAREREDVLFLAGECAGLLFLRDFADEAEDQ